MSDGISKRIPRHIALLAAVAIPLALIAGVIAYYHDTANSGQLPVAGGQSSIENQKVATENPPAPAVSIAPQPAPAAVLADVAADPWPAEFVMDDRLMAARTQALSLIPNPTSTVQGVAEFRRVPLPIPPAANGKNTNPPLPVPVRLTSLAVPAAETARLQQSHDLSNSATPSQLSADFDCGFAPNAVKIADDRFQLDFQGKSEYMFLFRLTGVKGKNIRIDIKGVPVYKWSTLNPVYRYANDGLPELPGMPADDAKLTDATTTKANNGALLPDTTGQAWHFIPSVWSDGGSAVLSFTQAFDQDSVLAAMKVPFTLDTEAALIAEAKQDVTAQVIDIGKTPEGRMLHLIKLSSGGAEGEKNHPAMLFYAREHADENDSSWLVAGALRRLLKNDALAQDLRSRFTFMFVPILDMDAAAHSQHENVISSFTGQLFTGESVAYAKFFDAWFKQGNRLDMVFDYHNVESAEHDHLECPLLPPTDSPFSESTTALLGQVYAGLVPQGFLVHREPWNMGISSDRLGGWLNANYGALFLPLEANSEQKARHLKTQELQGMGFGVAHAGIAFLGSGQGQIVQRLARDNREKHLALLQKYGLGGTTNNPFMAEGQIADKQRNDDILNAMLNNEKDRK